MKSCAEITKEVTWLEDMDEEQIKSIHECMKEYAREAIEEMAQNLDAYIMSIQPHWVQIERLKRKLQ